jgi:hypothetical protein
MAVLAEIVGAGQFELVDLRDLGFEDGGAELAPGQIASGAEDWLKTAFTSYFAAARAKSPKAARTVSSTETC